MTRNEKIINAAAADLRLEGMHVTAREKRIAMDCLSGKMSFNDAVAAAVKRYGKN